MDLVNQTVNILYGVLIIWEPQIGRSLKIFREQDLITHEIFVVLHFLWVHQCMFTVRKQDPITLCLSCKYGGDQFCGCFACDSSIIMKSLSPKPRYHCQGQHGVDCLEFCYRSWRTIRMRTMTSTHALKVWYRNCSPEIPGSKSLWQVIH